jgi:NagD protein
MVLKNYLVDMDGVLVHGKRLIPGANEFINQLRSKKRNFLVLTNNSIYTPRDLAHRLQQAGLEIDEKEIFTSSMATARFLKAQHPEGTAYVIGEVGLTQAIHDMGYIITDTEPDYMVLGETFNYSFEKITQAMRFVNAGAHFIATNPDPTGPVEDGLIPACGAMAALIQRATSTNPFFIGKPNPFMMRSALNYLGVHSENTVMIGDRMDTDIIAGVESGMETYLMLTGVTTIDMIDRYPYRPGKVFNSIADVQVE